MNFRGVVPRTCTIVTSDEFNSCQVLNGLPSTVSTPKISV